MRNHFVWLAALAFPFAVGAAERSFHFADYPLDHTPPGFRSVVAGQGQPGEWKVIEGEAASAMQKLSPNAPVTSRQAVLAQLSQDPADERFPILIFDGDIYGDFTLTTRFKLVRGALEQMAGIVFRMQDEKNFYVVRASGLGGNLRFYKMVSGIRSEPIGPNLEITRGDWHMLKVECKGNQIHIWLDDKEAMPGLTDNSFTAGRIGFWTKSDSVTYFGDTQLVYTPREPFAQNLIREVMKEQPRLRGIKIFTPTGENETLKVIASNQPSEIGQAGTEIEQKCFKTSAIFQAKSNGKVTVVMPLRDRNGETVAAVHLLMESFFGQTEHNVLARATMISKMMQARIQTAKDLTN